MFVRFIAAAIVFAQANGYYDKQSSVITCALNQVDSDLKHSFDLDFEGYLSFSGSQFLNAGELDCINQDFTVKNYSDHFEELD